MKRFLFCVLVLVAFSPLMVPELFREAKAETVSWTNPLTYTDSEPIPLEKAALLETEIQFRFDNVVGTWVLFGKATGGANILWKPYVTPGGTPSYWRVRPVSPADNNSTGAWTTPDNVAGGFYFFRPYQTPAPSLLLDVH